MAETRTSGNWNATPGNFDTVNTRILFDSGHWWGIPDLLPQRPDMPDPAFLVGYNEATNPSEIKEQGGAVHFFIDDYRFETVWTRPHRSAQKLLRAGCALTPDFSLYANWPHAVQMWNTYRSRWCGRLWQEMGIDVIPTLSWSDEDSYLYAFNGVPKGQVVAITACSIPAPEAQESFQEGLSAMIETIEPSKILCYGPIDEFTDFHNIPVLILPDRATQMRARIRASKALI